MMRASQPPVLIRMGSAPRRPAARSVGWVVGCLCLGALGFVVLHLFSPQEHGFYPRCGLYVWTGLHCPGCGSLRALHAMTHGDWGTALGSNALLTLGLAAALGWGAVRWWRGRPFGWQQYLTSPKGVLLGLGLVVLFGLLRNLPWFPFGLLAP